MPGGPDRAILRASATSFRQGMGRDMTLRPGSSKFLHCSICLGQGGVKGAFV